MNLKQQRAAALKAAQDIVAKAKAESRELSDDEQTEVEAKAAEVEDLDKRIAKAAKSESLIGRIGAIAPGDDESQGDGEKSAPAKSLGEHFVKAVSSDELARLKSVSGHTTSVAEWTPPSKASSDSNSTPSSLAPWGTEYDRTVVRGFRRPVVSDVMGAGTLSGNAVTYLIEGAVEGAFATVAEGGAKPQLHMADPTTRTDALKKIAGFMKFTDEMVEDFPFWQSEINNRGLYLLALAEENQLLNGAGTGSTVLGLLNRSGVQTEAAATGVSGADNADAIFRAMTKVQTATGLSADGIIINPVDYQALRLSKDANKQYYGGGFFAGQYGVGGVPEQPPLWGLRTIVSAAAASGTVVVSAFEASTTVYRKGGVRVESTNSNVDDFTNNLITTRIEERVALAVRIPAATVKVTLNYAAS